jgi:hypothetical protein
VEEVGLFTKQNTEETALKAIGFQVFQVFIFGVQEFR